MATPQELSNRYLELSRKYMRQAQEELDRGDWSQASEKAWGAVAEGVKSVSALRGWNHKSHPLLEDAITQLSMEFETPSLIGLFDSAGVLHVNYYEHRFNDRVLHQRLENCRELLTQLDQIRSSPQRPYSPSTREEQRILDRLTRFRPETAADSTLDIEALPPVEPDS